VAISIKDKVAVVVGASSGIGQSIAEALASEGMQVMAAARRDNRLAALKGNVAATFHCDVTKPEQVKALIAAALDRFAKIDVLVYSSGTNVPGRSMQRLTAEDWDTIIDTNLTGAFRCTKAVLPSMREAGGGLIVYISSISVPVADVSGAAYQASKHGMSGLARATSVEEKKNGIRTSVIFPGVCLTEILDKRPAPTPKEILDVSLEPEDVADAVVAIVKLHPRACVPELQIVPTKV